MYQFSTFDLRLWKQEADVVCLAITALTKRGIFIEGAPANRGKDGMWSYKVHETAHNKAIR